MVDVGSGNAYLGFVLYELFLKAAGKGELLCIESPAGADRARQERAGRLGFDADALRRPPPRRGAPARSASTSSPRCTPATRRPTTRWRRPFSTGADHVAVVPCCQAEVAAAAEGAARRGSATVAALFAHPWHRREFGSHLTNVIRALALEAHGYQVTVTELTGWEHSLKNELILGKKVHRQSARRRRSWRRSSPTPVFAPRWCERWSSRERGGAVARSRLGCAPRDGHEMLEVLLRWLEEVRSRAGLDPDA